MIATPSAALKWGVGLDDGQENHGTSVYGLIASKNEKCPGMAPAAEITVVKVFNDGNDVSKKDQV
jgi:hypothetical protein